MVYVYNGIQFSKEKNEIMPFAATWIDFEMIILRGVSQKRMTNTMWYNLCMETKILGLPRWY